VNRANVPLQYSVPKRVAQVIRKSRGNEFLFQMQAMMNIEVLNAYEARK
jgi:hypothetical protein